jgi:type IV secretory pathway VirB10-like protein
MAENPNPLVPPSLPPVQRLSRAVLLAATGLVTVTLLVVAFLATPRPLAHPPPAPRPPAGAAEPGFLQRPPASLPAARPPLTEQDYLRRLLEGGPPSSGGETSAGGAGRWAGGGAGESGNGGGRDGAGAAGGVAAPATAPLGLSPPPPLPPPSPRDARREAFQQALRAPLAQPVTAPARRLAAPWPPLPPATDLGIDGAGGGEVGADGPGVAAGAGGRASGEGADDAAAPRAATWPPAGWPGWPGWLGASAGSRGAAAAGPRAGAGAGGSSAKAAEGAGGGADRTGAGAEAARASGAPGRGGGATLAAGTVIPALLLTEVNSDLPGPLMAQVSRDVYDFFQQRVVLPRGTRLLGRYEHQVAVGQRRLLVAWTRLQLVDGRLLELPGLPAGDAGGAAGLPAQVQTHALRIFGDAVLLSVLSAGAGLSQPPPRSLVAAPSAGSVISAGVGQQLSDVGTQLLRRDLAISPTLRLPAGTPLTVLVMSDLRVAPGWPREAAPADLPLGGAGGPASGVAGRGGEARGGERP